MHLDHELGNAKIVVQNTLMSHVLLIFQNNNNLLLGIESYL